MKKSSVKKEVAKTNGKGPPLVPTGESRDFNPGLLLLDPQNLRLLERTQGGLREVGVKLIGQNSIQDKLYEAIWNDPLFDVKSLETSIAFNGFLKHEQLIVARYDAQKFLVLEGNRRLTAVRHLLAHYGPKLAALPPYVRQSLQTLPCFLLEGPPIDGSEELLKNYRRASEIYVGMRHLMGAKKWEPASRFEFQARLIDEGWSQSEVAERFGRSKTEVIRDLKAQRLYRDFREFERNARIEHSLTYNAFNEAARAGSIMKWLDWSNSKMVVTNKERENSFFHYLVSRLKARSRVIGEEGEEESPDESAEALVRRLRDMLKLRDDSIEDALTDRDFDSADLLFEEKREGNFAKRIASWTRRLGRVTSDELGDNPRENKVRLTELINQGRKIIVLLDALLKS